MIDLIATDYADLFRQLDGLTTKPKGLTIETPPETAVERIEMSAWKRMLDLLIDPNIIALMLSIGLIGIVVELWNPGLIFPGTVGAISLIVGLYGLQVLPISFAGLLLMLLATAFFVAGVHVLERSSSRPITFVIGALMPRRAGRAFSVSPRWRSRSIGPSGRLPGFRAPGGAVRQHRAEVGTHRLVGVTGHVRGDGLVFVDGELWHAQTADGSRLGPGERVVVEAVDQEGLRLTVGSAQPAPPLTAEGRDPLIGLIVVAAVALIVLMFLFAAIKVAREYERGVIFRLGRLLPEPEGAGSLPAHLRDRPDGEGRPARSR